jgi:hypothetical protein
MAATTQQTAQRFRDAPQHDTSGALLGGAAGGGRKTAGSGVSTACGGSTCQPGGQRGCRVTDFPPAKLYEDGPPPSQRHFWSVAGLEPIRSAASLGK